MFLLYFLTLEIEENSKENPLIYTYKTDKKNTIRNEKKKGFSLTMSNFHREEQF